MADALPHDLDAERSILGACMLDEAAFDTADAIVSGRHFYHPSHAAIFEAYKAVRDRNEPIDVITVSGELRSQERLNTIGGAQYLGELTDTLPTIAHLEAHCRRLRDLWSVRETIKAAIEIQGSGQSATDFAKFRNDAATRILEATDVTETKDPTRLEVAVREAFERIEETATRGRRISGLETGLRDLDTLTTGFHGGELIIVAARPGGGKTSLVGQFAVNVALRDGPVLFHELEMPRVQLANRILASEARVDQSRMRSGMLTQDDMTALTAAASKVYGAPLWIDEAECGLARVRAKARRMKRDGLRMVVVDYLTLMEMPDAERNDLAVGKITRGLKRLAMELDIPIILCAQLNRDAVKRGKDSRPQLHDLRQSGDIEQDADVVIFVHREELHNPNTEDRGIAELIVAKQRNGPFPETVRVRFIRELTRFENLAEAEHEYAPPPENEPVEPYDPYARGAA